MKFVIALVLLVAVSTDAVAIDCVTECNPGGFNQCPNDFACLHIGCSYKCSPYLKRQIACLAPCNADMLLRQLGLGSCNPGYICVFDGLCNSCVKASDINPISS